MVKVAQELAARGNEVLVRIVSLLFFDMMLAS